MIQRLRQHWWPERGELDEPHGSGQTTHGAQESASWPLGPDEQHQWNRQDAHIMPQPPDRWQTQADRDDDHAASGSETAWTHKPTSLRIAAAERCDTCLFGDSVRSRGGSEARATAIV